MPLVTVRQLLDAGVHFGHQTRRWNPKMRRFILGERNGIYLIDLHKTLTGIEAGAVAVDLRDLGDPRVDLDQPARVEDRLAGVR